MSTTSNDCLKEITASFLIELDKLTQAAAKKPNDSFFWEQADIDRIDTRKAVINGLFETLYNKMKGRFTVKPEVEEKKELHDSDNYHMYQITTYENIINDKEQRVRYIGMLIDNLSDEEAKFFLDELQKEIKLLLDQQPKEENDSSAALKTHCLDDQWLFTWLAKLMKNISEFLGVKTSSEQLLEETLAKNPSAGS